MLKTIPVNTGRRTELIDVTALVEKELHQSKIKEGFCLLHVPHTTAAITVNENADPSVRRDIIKALGRLVPEEGDYTHNEGNSDAHIKASLLGCDLTLLVTQGKLLLGRWQGIYFCEFDGPRSRELIVKIHSI